MRSPVKKATCRTFLCALAFASLASGQVVEKARTWADLQASHPCSSGLSGRITRLLDADSASDIGGGGGSTQVWVQCDGVDTWSIVSIGGGAGGGLSDSDYGDVAVSGSGTAMTVEALRGGAVAVAATTGNLQWEGTTADTFEGNFTFADPTADWTWAWGAAGTLTGPAGGATIIGGTGASDTLTLDGSAGTAGSAVVSASGRLQDPIVNGYLRMFQQESATSPGIFIGNGGLPSTSTFVALGIGLYKTGLLFTDATNAENSHDSGLQRYAAGVLATTDGTGLAYRHLMGGGAAVASATALPVPTGNGFHVTGTTNITSMTATNLLAGVVVTLIFDDVLTFTDGNNLKLAGDFVTTADDSISLYYDGTNFYEQSRSVN